MATSNEATREERFEAVSSAIEMLLQKHARLQLAALILGATDSQSLDRAIREGAHRHARTELTAAVYGLAATIVNGESDNGSIDTSATAPGTGIRDSGTEEGLTATAG